ncbi:MAG: hypothetical protein IPK22_28070 [Verrucomicrobiaceae bacterium]|nr:hypothetical protein [Verrucomicrobiaceae bacterium]
MIRRVTILCLAALSLSAGSLAAQTPAAEPPPKKTTLIDSLKKAIDGNKDKVSDETRQKAEAAARAAVNALPDDLKKKAQDLATGSKAAEIRQKAVQTVQGAMQSRETPPATPAVTETVAVASPAAPAPPVGPVPQRLQPLLLDDPQSARQTQAGRTEITATKSAYFDANTGIGIYRGNVRARHPNAFIECEELEIHMEKEKTGADGKKKAPKSGDGDILASRTEKKAAGSPALGGEDSGIEIAYARGTMVTIEKFDENGELQIGHCNEVAIYEGKTGNITLRGWPSVQRGSKLLEATDPRCVIVIDQAGRLKADGGVFRTTLIDEKAAAAPGSQPPAPTPAAPVRP